MSSAAAVVYFLCGGSKEANVEVSVGGEGIGFTVEVGSKKLTTKDVVAAKAIARSTDKGRDLFGIEAFEKSEVDHLCLFAADSTVEVDKLFEIVNQRLVLRTYLVGFAISLADCVMWSRVVKSGKELTGKYISRWFRHVDKLDSFQKARALIEGTNQTAPKERKGKISKQEVCVRKCQSHLRLSRAVENSSDMSTNFIRKPKKKTWNTEKSRT